MRDEYLRALYDLSKADPSRWATFVEAFKEFTAYELERSLTGSSGEAQVNLGMSRRIRELRDDFIAIGELASKIRKPHGTL